MTDEYIYWTVGHEETRWGSFDNILHNMDVGESEVKLKKLNIDPNANLSYQKHQHRMEVWTVSAGSGELIVGDSILILTVGASTVIPSGTWHAVKAGEDGLEVIEVQVGKECREGDIERKFYDWDETLSYIRGNK